MQQRSQIQESGPRAAVSMTNSFRKWDSPSTPTTHPDPPCPRLQNFFKSENVFQILQPCLYIWNFSLLNRKKIVCL